MNQEDAIREIHERYRQSGRSLNEVQRRHWAAKEAMKLGRGGITIVSKALRISRNTIRRGIQEIAAGQAAAQPRGTARIRKPGGGRKSKKTSPGRLTRTRPTLDSADAEEEFPAADRSSESRRDSSPLPTGADSPPLSGNASNQRPNPPENP